PKPVDEFQEAKALGFHTKPALIGPVTFLLLGKSRAAAFDRLEPLDALLPVYGEVLARLAAAGATWVQLDEPTLALDRTPQELAAALGLLERARERIGPDELWVAPSCSLLHVPLDLDLERRLDPDLKGWLAFAKQKLAEVVALTRAVRDGRQAVAAELEANARAIAARRSSRRI